MFLLVVLFVQCSLGYRLAGLLEALQDQREKNKNKNKTNPRIRMHLRKLVIAFWCNVLSTILVT